MTYKESRAVVQILQAALHNGGFHVQASERDGLTQERMFVSFGGDDGQWFTIIAEFDIEEEDD